MSREGAAWLAEVPELLGAHADDLTALRVGIMEAIIKAAELPDDARPDVRLEVLPDATDPTLLLQAMEPLALGDLRARSAPRHRRNHWSN
ncbi:MAG TPA: hypothetical protein VIU11_02200 [Nakamurella sp.]